MSDDDIDIDGMFADLNDVIEEREAPRGKKESTRKNRKERETSSRTTSEIKSTQREAKKPTKVIKRSADVQTGLDDSFSFMDGLTLDDSLESHTLDDLQIEHHVSDRRAKCSPAMLGDRGCTHLRCSNCDHKVIIINDKYWSDDSERVFFRRNVPDLERLATKLVFKRGAIAYACQCNWRSIMNNAKRTSAAKDADLRWFCAGY